MLTRAWGYAERMAQRHRFFPDGLAWMADQRRWKRLISRRDEGDAAQRSAG
jgi:hypothetical protein